MARRTRPKNDRLHESIRIYLDMRRADTEAEFRRLLVLHDECTDADGKPRLALRTLAEFRAGPRLDPARSAGEGQPAEVGRLFGGRHGYRGGIPVIEFRAFGL